MSTFPTTALPSYSSLSSSIIGPTILQGPHHAAAWCGPCRMVGPIIDELSEEYEGKAVVGKVDIDSNQQYAAQFGVRNIPTVLVFKNGELVDRKVGVSSKNDYAQALDNLI